MKFEFLEVPTGPTKVFPDRKYFLRPIIPIRIINPLDTNLFYCLRATVDSGADYSMIPLEIARKIGFSDFNEDKVVKFEPLGGKSFLGVFFDIILEIKGMQFNTFVCFTEQKLNWPILGCKGFFNLFEVYLDYSKRLIELHPRIKPLE